MGSTRDSAPDPTHPSGSARPPWPPPGRRRLMSGLAPTMSPRPSGDPANVGVPVSSPGPAPAGVPLSTRPPKFLDRLREAQRVRHYSRRTEQGYCQWVKRFNFFHHVRHPMEMAEPEINAFLTRPEVKAMLGQLTGDKWLMAGLMYGAGLRLMECLGLRVHDADLAVGQIVVRDGKGFKDRMTMLPATVKPGLQEHLAKVKLTHERDLADGFGCIQLPDALARKYPNAPTEWGWQFLFPQEKRWLNRQTGEQGRHHADPSILQRVVKAAAQTGLAKHATCHTLRHSFATHQLDDGYDIRTTQELLGHKEVKTTMIYTHVLNRGGKGVRGSVDAL